jgi:hypothetical protein
MSEQIPSGNHETLYPQSAVESYASASLHNNPLLYPGEHPDASFVTDGQFVSTLVAKNVEGNLEVQMHTPDGVRPVNDFLAENGAAPLEDRIPIIGYGSNLCPGSLRKKFEKIGRPDALIVPTLYTELSGADVVWSAGPGVNGNFIAGLYADPEVAETSVRVGLNMLTREQLLVMHATELNYNLRRIELQIDGVKFPAYFYSGGEVLLEDGKPVAVKGTSAKGRVLPEATTSDVLEQMLGNQVFQEKIAEYMGNGAVLPATPEAFVAYVASLKPTATDKQPKLKLKNYLQAAYAAANLARASQLANSPAVSWANPSTIPTWGESLRGLRHSELYLLPQQVIEPDAFANRIDREKVMRGIGAHFVRQSGLKES